MDALLSPIEIPATKEGVNPNAWLYLHPRVREIYEYCEITFDKMGNDCLITSMIRPKLDDTGIHATGRALDFVLRPREGGRRLATADCVKFAQYIALVFLAYKRPAIIYHSVGLGYHFHIQVDPTSGWVDLNGTLPEVAGATEAPLRKPV